MVKPVKLDGLAKKEIRHKEHSCRLVAVLIMITAMFLPAGIGGMWFAAHPLKFFNNFILIAIAIIMMAQLKKLYDKRQ